jgi:aminoglycoside phosphotransferase family enzyme
MENPSLIVQDLLKPCKIVETHISYLFITETSVYKLKKPVNFGFLDYVSLANRKKFCVLEKELNSRFCDNIYEEVLQIVKINGTYELLPVDFVLSDNTTVVDYLLKMKKIDESKFLTSLLESNKIDEEAIFKLGVLIARTLKRLPESSMECGGYDVIKYNVEENFEQTIKFVQNFLDVKIYNYIKGKTLNFLKNNEELFKKRLVSGLIKDGHGDIRIEHIFIDNEKAGIIDCIEFNERFRSNDAVSDFMFLCMELDQKGFINLSDCLLKGFLDVFTDNDSKKLINFYKCYRALVRAKVGCFFLEQKRVDWPYYKTKRKEIEKLLYLAFSYAFNIDNFKTIIFYGLMGSGKSRNAKVFSENFCAAYFNTDIYRKSMFNIPSEERHYVTFGSGIYSDDVTLQVYDGLGASVEEKNKLCRFSVVDGSFSKKAYLEAFTANKAIDVIKVKCEASIDEIKRRLNKREKDKSISDGRASILADQISNLEDIEPHIILNTEDSLEAHALKLAHQLIDLENEE